MERLPTAAGLSMMIPHIVNTRYDPNETPALRLTVRRDWRQALGARCPTIYIFLGPMG